uniref:Uncharacterized protein n=1 Tax=Meloidogyne floridensis TaxID=298350 RepID=A0A915NAJ7_9BILA
MANQFNLENGNAACGRIDYVEASLTTSNFSYDQPKIKPDLHYSVFLAKTYAEDFKKEINLEVKIAVEFVPVRLLKI